MKKHNTKGFSLVELIVVIAIMAVLVGVLAPSLLRYVEKTREQKDHSAIAEVIQAAKIALADEEVANEVAAGDTITISGSTITYTVAAATGTSHKLQDEVGKTITSIAITSNTHKNQTYTITFSTVNGTVVPNEFAEGNWS